MVALIIQVVLDHNITLCFKMTLRNRELIDSFEQKEKIDNHIKRNRLKKGSPVQGALKLPLWARSREVPDQQGLLYTAITCIKNKKNRLNKKNKSRTNLLL